MAVHPLVQLAQERFLAHSLVDSENRMSHAQAQFRREPAVAVESRDVFLQALHHLQQLAGVGVWHGQDDDELIAAVSGDQVTMLKGAAQDRADRFQDSVPDIVAVNIVDLLEPVDVQHDAAIKTPAFAVCNVFQIAVQFAPVGQSGQMIRIQVRALDIQVDDQ